MKMRFLILVAILGTSLGCQNTPREEEKETDISGCDCKQFRTGKFVLYDNFDKQRSWTIERNDSLQLETEINTGYYSVSTVTWHGDCEYELLRISNNGEKLGKDQPAPQPLRVNITDCKKDYYLFTSFRDSANKINDTIWVKR